MSVSDVRFRNRRVVRILLLTLAFLYVVAVVGIVALN
jgi:hypothetical protein